MPFLIVTSFAYQEPIISRINNKAKLAPINGTYTGPLGIIAMYYLSLFRIEKRSSY